jgi:acyl transferase domain-containing protein
MDLTQMLYPQQATFDAQMLASTCLAQPALFVVEYALARLFLSWGIKPAVMLGHSIGEYVAACLAGVFSLKDALELVAVRGRLMQAMPGGEMLGVALSASQVEEILPEGVVIAAINAPLQTVVAGSFAAIEVFITKLEAAGEPAKYLRLNTSHAFHSPMMAPVIAEYRRKLLNVNLNPPQQRLLSNVTGQWLTDEQATSVDYWCEQLLQPVCFGQEIQTLLDESSARLIFVEMGPGKTLSGMVAQYPATDTINCLTTDSDAQSDQGVLIDALAQLWLRGVKPDWRAFYAGQSQQRLPLPTYDFERETHWVEPNRQSINEGVIDCQFRAAIENAYVQVGDDKFSQQMIVDAVKANAAEAIAVAIDKQIGQVIEQLISTKALDGVGQHSAQACKLLVDNQYTEVEYRVAEVFAQVLGLDEFSVVDDFFALGGDSLLAVQLLDSLKTIGINIDMKVLINGATIQSIAAQAQGE